MEIELVKEGTTVIRKIANPAVHLDIANGTVTVSGKDVITMQGGGEFTGEMRQLCAPEPSFGMANTTPEETAKTTRNTAKETAKVAYLLAHEVALQKYVKACFLIDNPVTV
jgi:hypothetical protein